MVPTPHCRNLTQSKTKPNSARNYDKISTSPPLTNAMPTAISDFFDKHREFAGNLLVALQFGLLLLLAVMAAPQRGKAACPS